MISSPFNTSASNFGNAAMRAASRPIPLDAQVEMRLDAHGPGFTTGTAPPKPLVADWVRSPGIRTLAFPCASCITTPAN